MRAHNRRIRFAAAATLAALALAPVGAAAEDQHTVQPGETLSGIAARNHTTVRALAEANGLGDANRIIAGQVLVIPAAGSAAGVAPATVVHVVAPGRDPGEDRGAVRDHGAGDRRRQRDQEHQHRGHRRPADDPGWRGGGCLGRASRADGHPHRRPQRDPRGDRPPLRRERRGRRRRQRAHQRQPHPHRRRADIPAASAGGAGTPATSAYAVIGSDGRTGLTGTYVVQAGESLRGIARQFGVAPEAIAAANGILPPFGLYANARLVLSAPNRLPTTWPAARSPGPPTSTTGASPARGGRAHEGTDLFAPRGTPVLAPVAGVVSHAVGAIGGNQFRLRGDDGTIYFGSHMDNFGASGRVNAGDVVGYVGDSGNARGGRTHLHFEIHPDDGAAMNPYPAGSRRLWVGKVQRERGRGGAAERGGPAGASGTSPVGPLPQMPRRGRVRRESRRADWISPGRGRKRRVRRRNLIDPGAVFDADRRGRDRVDAIISLRGVTKRFGSHTVLEDISFDIPRGQISAIMGPSGTGKSVLLKNIIGLLRPDAGEIWVDGEETVRMGEKDLYRVRRKFGVLFQDGALFGSMNMYDNIAFPLREHTRKSEKEIREITLSKAGDGRDARPPEEVPRRGLRRHAEAGRPGPGAGDGPRDHPLRRARLRASTRSGCPTSTSWPGRSRRRRARPSSSSPTTSRR